MLGARTAGVCGATVVIPTLNRGAYLIDSLRDLLAQSHRPLELLIVDQSSECPADVTALIQAHPDVVSYHRVGFRGLLLARNYGWQRARHEAIVYVDDDIRCAPDFVANHVRTLLEPKVGAVAGGIDEENVEAIPGQLRRTRGFRRWTGSPLGPYSDQDSYDVDAVKGCNFSIWRSALVALGGFDERLNVGAALYEDLELSLRLREAGFRIRFDGKARLQHLAAVSGGCRVPNPRKYVEAMAHNRGLIMSRHLRWSERPSALVRLAWLVSAYCRANRDLGVIGAGLRGFALGARQGRAEPLCGTFDAANVTGT
jgi:GT2 family glycosyltransferase